MSSHATASVGPSQIQREPAFKRPERRHKRHVMSKAPAATHQVHELKGHVLDDRQAPQRGARFFRVDPRR